MVIATTVHERKIYTASVYQIRVSRGCNKANWDVPGSKTHLLRQMMSADVEGSCTGFLPAPLLAAGGGVLDALSPSVAALFFFRAIFFNSLSMLTATCGVGDVVTAKNSFLALARRSLCHASRPNAELSLNLPWTSLSSSRPGLAALFAASSPSLTFEDLVFHPGPGILHRKDASTATGTHLHGRSR